MNLEVATESTMEVEQEGIHVWNLFWPDTSKLKIQPKLHIIFKKILQDNLLFPLFFLFLLAVTSSHVYQRF
jgi:hypothetical protein